MTTDSGSLTRRLLEDWSGCRPAAAGGGSFERFLAVVVAGVIQHLLDRPVFGRAARQPPGCRQHLQRFGAGSHSWREHPPQLCRQGDAVQAAAAERSRTRHRLGPASDNQASYPGHRLPGQGTKPFHLRRAPRNRES